MMMTVHHSEPDPTPERTILEAAANLLRDFNCPDDYTTRLAHHLSEDLRYFLTCADRERGATVNTDLERPYIVYDMCGRQWTAAVEEPRECENCGSVAPWAFPDPTTADTHAMNDREWRR